MIEANKYLNLHLSVLNVSSIILRILYKKDIVKYDELLRSLENKVGEEVKNIFIPSLSFLFLLNKIEYFKKIDAFSLKNETKQDI